MWVTRAAVLAWYPLAILALIGAVALRRKRIVVYPLGVVLLTVLITTAIAFGTSRYRAAAEPAICILAAVGISRISGTGARLRDEAGVRRGATVT